MCVDVASSGHVRVTHSRGSRGASVAPPRALYATRPFTPEGVFLAVSLAVC